MEDGGGESHLFLDSKQRARYGRRHINRVRSNKLVGEADVTNSHNNISTLFFLLMMLAMIVARRNVVEAAAAFSTYASPAITSLLKDPTILGDLGSVSSGVETFDVIDPGASPQQFNDGSAIIAKVHQRMGREDTKKAIDRASAALGKWKDGTTALHRSNVLSKWSSLITENSEDIAKIMTLESGKPLAESKGEVAYGTSFLDYFAGEAIRPGCSGGGYMSPSPFTDGSGAPRGKIMAINEAVGVCGLM